MHTVAGKEERRKERQGWQRLPLIRAKSGWVLGHTWGAYKLQKVGIFQYFTYNSRIVQVISGQYRTSAGPHMLTREPVEVMAPAVLAALPMNSTAADPATTRCAWAF